MKYVGLNTYPLECIDNRLAVDRQRSLVAEPPVADCGIRNESSPLNIPAQFQPCPAVQTFANFNKASCV